MGPPYEGRASELGFQFSKMRSSTASIVQLPHHAYELAPPVMWAKMMRLKTAGFYCNNQTDPSTPRQ